MPPEPTGTTTRQYCRSRMNCERVSITVHCRDACTASIFRQQTSYKCLFIQIKQGTSTQRTHERSLNLCSRGIPARMQHTPTAMSSLATKQEAIVCGMCIATRLRSIKLNSHLHKPVHSG